MHRVSSIAVALFALLNATAEVHADCVVLLHGLARSSKAMVELETAFRARGYSVANVDYPSREKPIQELSRIAISSGLETCNTRPEDRIHFVTHSMGGILIRYYLENYEIENLGHVVMIAPPNQGSEVVDSFAKVPGFELVNGPAGLQLGTGEDSIPLKLGPVDYSVGVIAGTKTLNPVLSQSLPNPDDGKVSVESTKVAGMADFRLVAASHPFIMQDETAIRHAIAFIETGAFLEDAP